MLERLVAWLGVIVVPEYNFVCHECKMFFDKEYSMKNAPGRSKCPECNKLSNRDWQEVAVHFKGDCHTNRRLEYKANNSKFEQDRFAKTLVHKTKQSLNDSTTEQFYSKMVPGETWSEQFPEYKYRHIDTREKEERDRKGASIGRTIDALGSYHKHQPRRHKLKDDPKFKKD